MDENTPVADSETIPLVLQVNPGLYRAFQRCLWIMVNETGRDRGEIVEEMIHEFLVKQGC